VAHRSVLKKKKETSLLDLAPKEITFLSGK